MKQFTLRLPPELETAVLEVAALGFQHNESETIRECVRRAIPSVKKDFISGSKAHLKKTVKRY